jgi:enterochelin esterase family protein
MIKSRIIETLGLEASKEQREGFLKNHSFPLVEDSIVTFVFSGHAEKVAVRHWIYGLPASLPLVRYGASDLWYRSMEFPTRSRIEYKLGITRNGHEDWIFDPLNRNIAHDPFGGNSVVHCRDYQDPEWSFEMPRIPQGRFELLELHSNALGDWRKLRIYLPANFRDYRRYRLMIVHDGEDYVRYSRLKQVLDNLIGRLEIPPMIVALTNPHDRLKEYANDERHSRHIVEEVIPALEQKYPVIREGSGRCLMGASFGGVASLSTAWRYPHVFESLLLQSGSFAFTDIGDHWRTQAFDPVVEFMNRFRASPGNPAKNIFLSCGVYESLIYENRSLVPFLRSHGFNVKFEEAYDGHNWENWRNRLRSGLSWLFPGPLWVTYM